MSELDDLLARRPESKIMHLIEQMMDNESDFRWQGGGLYLNNARCEEAEYIKPSTGERVHVTVKLLESE